MILQAFHQAFFCASFQALWTEMVSVHLNIAKIAKEPAASFAWNSSPFLRMIKATRLALHHDSLAGRTGFKRTETGWEHLDLQKGLANLAGSEFRSVENLGQQ
jgi:hypothetical protein